MIKGFNKKIFISVAVIFLIAAGLIWLSLFWQFGKIKSSADNIQKEQLDSEVRQERNQKVLELGKELGDVEERSKEMQKMLVEKENAVPFLGSLEAIASQTNSSIKINVTDLTKLKPSQKQPVVQESSDTESTKDIQKEDQAKKAAQSSDTKPDFSNQLGFSLELTGKYNSFVDFLTKLENLPYFVRVYSFQVAPAGKTQSASQPAGSGVSQSSPQSGQPSQSEEANKDVKSTMIIIVYTNGKK